MSDIRTDISDIRGQMATTGDMQSLRADVASDIQMTRKDLGEQIVGLRRAVMEYHTSSSAMAF